jgi:anaerobic magnesium-protoporphyrin IX monomethyl ester cyclase
VLEEIARHHADYGATLFTFTDLKLNSNVQMWRAIIGGIRAAAPGARWIAAVHVNADRGDNGLSADDLRAAAASGCVRLTTGLESGSQRVLDLMHKGTRLDLTARYLRDAHAAGVSCRCTMISGYPGETADDVRASTAFLRAHGDAIERVSLNRFQIMTGTGVHKMMQRDGRGHGQSPASAGGRAFAGLTQVTVNHRLAQVDHHYAECEKPDYRRATMELLEAVHAINRKPLKPAAREFEGVM